MQRASGSGDGVAELVASQVGGEEPVLGRRRLLVDCRGCRVGLEVPQRRLERGPLGSDRARRHDQGVEQRPVAAESQPLRLLVENEVALEPGRDDEVGRQRRERHAVRRRRDTPQRRLGELARTAREVGDRVLEFQARRGDPGEGGGLGGGERAGTAQLSLDLVVADTRVGGDARRHQRGVERSGVDLGVREEVLGCGGVLLLPAQLHQLLRNRAPVGLRWVCRVGHELGER